MGRLAAVAFWLASSATLPKVLTYEAVVAAAGAGVGVGVDIFKGMAGTAAAEAGISRWPLGARRWPISGVKCREAAGEPLAAASCCRRVSKSREAARLLVLLRMVSRSRRLKDGCGTAVAKSDWLFLKSSCELVREPIREEPGPRD